MRKRENMLRLPAAITSILSLFLVLSFSSLSFANEDNCGRKVLELAEKHKYEVLKSPGYSGGEDVSVWHDGTIDMPCEFLLKPEKWQLADVLVHIVYVQLDDNSPGCHNNHLSIYDGDKQDKDNLLARFCTTTFHSKDYHSTLGALLLVFQTDDLRKNGFEIQYSQIDEQESNGKPYPTGGSPAGGIIVAACIPALVIYFIIFCVVYRRCKKNARMRDERLTATELTPQNHQNGRAGRVRTTRASNGTSGQRQNRRVREPYPLADIILSHSSETSTPNQEESHRRGRVRHPAGDVNAEPVDDAPLLQHHNGATHNGLGPDQVRLRSQPNSRNNSPARFPVDPSGVYSERDISEMNDNPPAYPATQPTQYYLSHVHPDEDSRSRASSRHSFQNGGRNSPREGSHSGRGSPYRHRHSPRPPNPLDGGQTLTYYGLIDQNPVPPSINVVPVDDDTEEAETCDHMAPPPSYEEAATGKYSPAPRP